MPTVSAFALQLVDPRGRANRKGLLLAAALLLFLQAAAGLGLWTSGADLFGYAALILNLGFCWVGFAAVSKRLHDLGRSIWWVPTAILGWLAAAIALAVAVVLIGDPEMLAPGTPGYWLLLGAMMAPLLMVAIWLHTSEGEAGANRYGPAPTGAGFSMPADAGTWLRRPAAA